MVKCKIIIFVLISFILVSARTLKDSTIVEEIISLYQAQSTNIRFKVDCKTVFKEDTLIELYIKNHRGRSGVDLSEKQSRKVWKLVRKLKNLEKLSLGQIHDLPKKNSGYKSLEYLKIDSDNLMKLDKKILHFHNISKLDVRGKNWHTITSHLTKVKTLKTLYLHGNYQDTLPMIIGKLTQLNNLVISKMHISDSIFAQVPLQNLQSLTVTNSPLPFSLVNLKALRQLNYQEILHFTADSIYSMSPYPINKIPSIVSLLPELKSLFITSSNLDTLPDATENLANIERLHFTGVTWSAIPSSLLKLTKMNKLEINYSHVNTLSGELLNMPSLKTLILESSMLCNQPISLIQSLKKNGVSVIINSSRCQ